MGLRPEDANKHGERKERCTGVIKKILRSRKRGAGPDGILVR